jgi:hypothetical protein
VLRKYLPVEKRFLVLTATPHVPLTAGEYQTVAAAPPKISGTFEASVAGGARRISGMV